MQLPLNYLAAIESEMAIVDFFSDTYNIVIIEYSICCNFDWTQNIILIYFWSIDFYGVNVCVCFAIVPKTKIFSHA